MPRISECFIASWITPQMLALMTAVGPPDCPIKQFPRRALMGPLPICVKKGSARLAHCPPMSRHQAPIVYARWTTRPPIIVVTTLRSGVRITMSASLPGSRLPLRSATPMDRAGVSVPI